MVVTWLIVAVLRSVSVTIHYIHGCKCLISSRISVPDCYIFFSESYIY